MAWKAIIDYKSSMNLHEKIIRIASVSYREEYFQCLFSGNMGKALFYSYLNKLTNKKNYMDDSVNLIECSIRKSNNNPQYNFSFGLAGMLWCLNHLQKVSFFSPESNLFSREVEKKTFDYNFNELKKGNNDYMHGGLGMAIFFLDRLPDNFAYECLEKIVDQLYSNADIKYDEIKWKFFNVFHPNDNLSSNYNLGLSHGIPSIINILSKIYSFGILQEKCFQMITGCINWILRTKFTGTLLSCFSYSEEGTISKIASRLAWCYGDLGIASTLWQVGLCTSNENWKKEAIKIMLHSSKRKNLEENMVDDAGFCHGTAGIAHIFNRFYQATHIQEFKDAAIYWFNETLYMAKFKDGLAGYKSYDRQVPGGSWNNNTSLLEGTTGIGLALISAISDIEPKWDRCLLLS